MRNTMNEFINPNQGGNMVFFRVLLLVTAICLIVGCSKDNKSDPAGPVASEALEPLSTLSFTGGERISNALLDYPYLYVAGAGCYLGIIDVSDSVNPVLVGSINSSAFADGGGPGGPNTIAKHGGYVFSTFWTTYNTPDSLVIFDVSSPANPTIANVIQSFKYPYSSEYFHFGEICIVDTILYRDHGVRYTINSLPNVQLLDTVDIGSPLGCNAVRSHIKSAGDNVCFTGVCGSGSPAGNYLWICDGSTGSLEAYFELPSDVGYSAMESLDSRLFVWQPCIVSYEFGNHIAEIDLSSPQNPSTTQILDVPDEYTVDNTPYQFILHGMTLGNDFNVFYGPDRTLVLYDNSMAFLCGSVPADLAGSDHDYFGVNTRGSMIYAMSQKYLDIFSYTQ